MYITCTNTALKNISDDNKLTAITSVNVNNSLVLIKESSRWPKLFSNIDNMLLTCLLEGVGCTYSPSGR